MAIGAASLARWRAIEPAHRGVVERSLCQPTDMVADVARPTASLGVESVRISSEQRSHGFLETRLVTGHRRTETVGGILRLPCPIAPGVGVACAVHELPQRARSATSLRREPRPVPGQESDFARDNTQPGSTRAAPSRAGRDRLLSGVGGRWRDSPKDILNRAPQVEFDWLAGGVVEDEHLATCVTVSDFLRGSRDVAKSAGRDPAVTVEGRAANAGGVCHRFVRRVDSW